MTTTDLFAPLTFARGPAMKNRIMLAPLTNLQSHADGTLSDDEFRWLTLRADGGFGLVMTCAAHVQAIGQGFPGQLGIFGDEHIPGLTRLAAAIKAQGSVAVVQIHHAGMRSPSDLIGQAPVCPSDNTEFGARALTATEIETLIADFVAAARRAEIAGFDGVEIHGAHGYIVSQFLSPEVNQRDDKWGGSAANRERLLDAIIAGIRRTCRADFNLGLRLSPERFGLRLAEVRDHAQRLMRAGDIDYLDMSLWDIAKEPVEEDFKGASLMSVFTGLDRGNVRLGVAGKVMSAQTARGCLANGADFVLVGRGAILHHDWPKRAAADVDFVPVSIPVSREHLQAEGLGPAFIDYMAGWKGFVEG